MQTPETGTLVAPEKIQVSENGTKKQRSDVLKMITTRREVISAVKVTPEIAQELLSLNEFNRPLTKPLVDRFTNDMKEGNWIFAGNTLKFSNEKKLLDGQHSLTAVINSGTTQLFNIQTGLEPLSFRVMDNGKIRSGSDVLAMRGYTDPTPVASAIKSLINYERSGNIRSYLHYQRITNIDVDKWTENTNNMSLLMQCANFIIHDLGNKIKLLSNAQWIFIFYLLSKKHSEQAKEFITKLAKGQDISRENHPQIYLARERLIAFHKGQGAMEAMRKGSSAIFELKLRFVIAAWNAWRKKEHITKLTFNAKEPKIEKPI